MWPESENLKLGKGTAFVKSKLRRLPLSDAEFEADFWLDPTFSTQRREAWTGMVIEREFGVLLAMEVVERPPTVNDFATLLAHAMFRPLDEEYRQRPRTICLRDRPQWQELLPHIRELGIEVVINEDLPGLDEAAVEWMQRTTVRKASRKLPSVDKFKQALKRPFPKRKQTGADAAMALMKWTDGMMKAAYPSARQETSPSYNPMTKVAIRLTAEERQVILAETRIAKTKKLRPRLEAAVGAGQDHDLTVHEWGMVCLALCGATAHSKVKIRRQLLQIAEKIVCDLSEALGIAAPDDNNRDVRSLLNEVE